MLLKSTVPVHSGEGLPGPSDHILFCTHLELKNKIHKQEQLFGYYIIWNTLCSLIIKS